MRIFFKIKSTLLFTLPVLSILLNPGFVYTADHYVANPSLVPIYVWACGCVPMSCAMALGYWDNYDFETSTGNFGYGRLNKYYMERKLVANYKGSDGNPFYYSGGSKTDTIPYMVIELAKAMNTKSTGWTSWDGVGSPVTTAIKQVANTINGYNFDSIATHYNNTNWSSMLDKIKTEINSSRPFDWNSDSAYSDNSGHSVCAIGYSDTNYVIVYNTWDDAKHWWYYYNYQIDSWIFTVEPGGGSSDYLKLYSPDGGENWYGDMLQPIRWYQWGTAIDNVIISYTITGGDSDTWRTVTSQSPSSPGWNSYDWTVPNINSTDVMVKIEGWQTGIGTPVACDGSRHIFSISQTDYNTSFGYPNPCYLETAGYVRISNIHSYAADVKIYIYNIAGELVRELGAGNGVETYGGMQIGKWDGRNNDGEKAASGVYIYLIKGDENPKTGKVAILW